MFSSDPKKPLYRGVYVLVALAFLGLGLGPILSRGDLFYENWYGELVFCPVAIAAGLLTLWAALFKPEILGKRTGRAR